MAWQQRGVQPILKALSQRSELPQQGHSPADAHVVVVEVAEPGEGQSRERQDACLDSFLRCGPWNVVSDNLAKAPVAVESEGCGQGVVRRRARVQISSWKEAQEHNTNDPLGSPMERCSPGAGVAAARQVDVLRSTASGGTGILKKC